MYTVHASIKVTLYPVEVTGRGMLRNGGLSNSSHRNSNSTNYSHNANMYLPITMDMVSEISSVTSPICQEGQSERTFPIFAFSSRFFLFSPDFSLFLANFLLSGVALCPLAPPVAMPLHKILCNEPLM